MSINYEVVGTVDEKKLFRSKMGLPRAQQKNLVVAMMPGQALFDGSSWVAVTFEDTKVIKKIIADHRDTYSGQVVRMPFDLSLGELAAIEEDTNLQGIDSMLLDVNKISVRKLIKELVYMYLDGFDVWFEFNGFSTCPLSIRALGDNL